MNILVNCNFLQHVPWRLTFTSGKLAPRFPWVKDRLTCPCRVCTVSGRKNSKVKNRADRVCVWAEIKDHVWSTLRLLRFQVLTESLWAGFNAAGSHWSDPVNSFICPARWTEQVRGDFFRCIPSSTHGGNILLSVQTQETHRVTNMLSRGGL